MYVYVNLDECRTNYPDISVRLGESGILHLRTPHRDSFSAKVAGFIDLMLSNNNFIKISAMAFSHDDGFNALIKIETTLNPEEEDSRECPYAAHVGHVFYYMQKEENPLKGWGSE